MAAPVLKETTWFIQSNASGPVARAVIWGAVASIGILSLAFGHYCKTHPESVSWMRTRGGSPASPADDALVGYYSGAFFLLISVLGYFFSEDILTTVDCKKRQLVIRYQNKLGNRFRVIPFQNVEKIFVLCEGVNGKDPDSSLVRSYSLGVRLGEGSRLSFGASSIIEGDMVELAQRLEDSTGAKYATHPSNEGFAAVVDQSVVLQYVISAAGSIGLIYLYYKFHGGTFIEMIRCPSTPLFLALLFLIISRRVRWHLRSRY